MTEVHISTDGHQFVLTATGHANFGEAGKDIVCAAVSTLIYTLANAIDNLGAIDELILREGDVRIVASIKDDTDTAVLETVFDVIRGGFRMLETKYRDHVKLF